MKKNPQEEHSISVRVNFDGPDGPCSNDQSKGFRARPAIDSSQPIRKKKCTNAFDLNANAVR